ncbi:MAG TPA: hypothetical protein VLJ76_06495 [Gaiellaceae bacterium]|nr:hypothetical protein [Gaiellaceae bacterium]
MVVRLTLAALAAFCASAVAATAGGDQWAAAHARLSYTIYKPKQTLGYKISGFGYQPCPGGKSKSSIYATYGTYKGVLLSKTKGFGIFEGSPAICSDHAEFTSHGTRVIGGVKATLGVYCDVPNTCSLAKGVTNGFILLWKRGATRIQMDSSHLTLAQFLEVATSLAKVG